MMDLWVANWELRLELEREQARREDILESFVELSNRGAEESDPGIFRPKSRTTRRVPIVRGD